MPGRDGYGIPTRIDIKLPEHKMDKPEMQDELIIRRMRITRKDVEEHGTTSGCPGCKAVRYGKTACAHSEECRNRIESKIGSSEKGKERIQRELDRQNELIARRMEADERATKRSRTLTERESDTNQEDAGTPPCRGRPRAQNNQEDAGTPPCRGRPRAQQDSNGQSSSSSGSSNQQAVTTQEDSEMTDATNKRRIENDTDEVESIPKRRRDASLAILERSVGPCSFTVSEEMQTRSIMNLIDDVMHDELPHAEGDLEQSKITIEGWDDVSGKPLDADKVQQARYEEIQYFKKHCVYKRVQKGTSVTVTGKIPIKTRWIDINKGDDTTPNYRSRLVAK